MPGGATLFRGAAADCAGGAGTLDRRPMRRFRPLALALSIGSCALPNAGPEPSLAPRAAEAIDPRVPVPDAMPVGTVDVALASRLAELVGAARAGVQAFDARQAEATRLAASAGGKSSEGWIAAQQALSRLSAQHGVTTNAAADIDALAATRLQQQKFIAPADRAAIAAAAAEVAAISDAQAAVIARLSNQLAR